MTNKHSPSKDKLLLRKKKINSYLLFLQNIFKELSDGKPHQSNMTFNLKKENLTWWYGAQLIKSNILEKKENGVYIWKNLSEKPSLELAEQLYDTTLERMRKYHNSKEEKLILNKSEKKDKIKIDNIKKFLDSIYPLMQGITTPILAVKLRLREQALKFHLHQHFIAALVDANVLSRSGQKSESSYKWEAGKPSLQMAEKIFLAEKKVGKIARQTRGVVRGKYNKKNENEVQSSKDTSKKQLWKDIAHKAINMDDPELALKALNKLS